MHSAQGPGFSVEKPGLYFLLFLRAPAGLFQRRPARGQNHIPRPGGKRASAAGVPSSG